MLPPLAGFTLWRGSQRIDFAAAGDCWGGHSDTFRQNAVDVFMDCPSRERAGWLCDSFFTARVAQDLTGTALLERMLFENYRLPDTFAHLPEGMLPMCYPARLAAHARRQGGTQVAQSGRQTPLPHCRSGRLQCEDRQPQQAGTGQGTGVKASVEPKFPFVPVRWPWSRGFPVCRAGHPCPSHTVLAPGALSRHNSGMETSPKRPTEAWLDPRLAASGFGYVIVARFKASGDTEAGVFLVDLKCLGVKNAFLSRLTLQEYETRLLGDLRTNTGTFESVSPACARKLVEGAIAYARTLGLEPHEDYRLAQRVLGGIHPADCDSDRAFIFGDKGKPLFIQGPKDSPQFVARVMAQLERRCGPNGFHYVLSLREKPWETDSDLPPQP